MEPTTETIDEHMAQFEHDIRQLKIEYEQYFGGGRKRPPVDIEWRIDLLLKRYSDRGGQMSFAQRFRFGNLTQTYVKYREIFHKRMRKREEGTTDRHFGSAARAVEAERARIQRAQSARPETAVVITCSDPEHEPSKVDQLYTAFREALKKSGESTDRLSRAQFQQFVEKKTEQLRKQKGTLEVEYIVSVEGGKARLKARTNS